MNKNSCIDYEWLVHFVQEYALPVNYIMEPPSGLLWNAKVDYNIVTTLVITVFHIFSVKDLSSHRNVYTVTF